MWKILGELSRLSVKRRLHDEECNYEQAGYKRFEPAQKEAA